MRNLLLLCCCLAILSCNTSPKEPTSMIPENFDWQGHRGCRGILPENSIPGFLKALEYPIQTLELDIVVSGDNQLIISHEPWMGAHICHLPDGSPIAKDEEMKLPLIQMTFDQIREFDCGSKGNVKFPEQVKMQTYKPRLLDMIGTVETYCEDRKRTPPHYNIEIKSLPQGYDKLIPRPEVFVELVLSELKKVDLVGRTTVQSFDINVIEELVKQKSPYKTAYLVENPDTTHTANLALLTFKPDIYSPNFKLLTKEVVDDLHANDIQVVPWTVNEVADMRNLIKMGVDGIITDYPNRIAEVDQPSD